jgi:hypothetical protein
MRLILAGFLLAAAVANADTITLVREEQIQEGAYADAKIDVWMGLTGFTLSPSAWAGPDPVMVYGESWVSLAATMELQTFGPVRDGWVTISSWGGAESSHGSNLPFHGGFGVGPFGGEDLTNGTFALTLGVPFEARVNVHAYGSWDYGMITSAWITTMFYEADGTTPVPVYWADAVPTPEPGSLALVLLAAVAYQGFVFFVRQPMPSRLRK